MNKINTNKGYILPLVIGIVVIVGVIGWFVYDRSVARNVNNTTGIELLSPNGRETFMINVAKQAHISVTASTTESHVVLVTLEPGSIPLGYLPANTESFLLFVPSIALKEGDMAETINPGKYKVKVTLYDGQPCLGFCAEATTTAKVIAWDETDSEITVVANPDINNVGTTTPVNNL